MITSGGTDDEGHDANIMSFGQVDGGADEEHDAMAVPRYVSELQRELTAWCENETLSQTETQGCRMG